MPSVAASLLDNPKLSLGELTSEAIMDIMNTLADGSDPLNQKPTAVYETSKKLIEECGDETSSVPPSSETDTDKTECPAPSLPIPESVPAQGLAVSYIFKFYNNINLYGRDNAKKSSEPPLSGLLQNLKSMLVNHLVLVLQGRFGLEKCRKSPLLPYIMIGNAPIGIISDLLCITYKDQEVFEEVFIAQYYYEVLYIFSILFRESRIVLSLVVFSPKLNLISSNIPESYSLFQMSESLNYSQIF